MNPIFEFRDNETEADYKIFENGEVFKQTDRYGKFDDVGLVINRISQLRQTIAQSISELTRTHPFDKCITWFGRTQTEVAKALDYWDKRNKEIKMTREEAINAIVKNDPTATIWFADVLTNALDVLGLIKFEKKETYSEPWAKILDINGNVVSVTLNSLIKGISEFNYKVEKK